MLEIPGKIFRRGCNLLGMCQKLDRYNQALVVEGCYHTSFITVANKLGKLSKKNVVVGGRGAQYWVKAIKPLPLLS